ncbi:hypothetical protein V6Z11_A10G041700 [Gossypium hirsutum]
MYFSWELSLHGGTCNRGTPQRALCHSNFSMHASNDPSRRLQCSDTVLYIILTRKGHLRSIPAVYFLTEIIHQAAVSFQVLEFYQIAEISDSHGNNWELSA